MPHKGGSANISGVEYEQWFVAYHLAKTFLNAEIEVTPQARYMSSGLPTEEDTIASIDDVVIHERGVPTFYTIKKYAPSEKWSLGDLKSKGVISAMLAQHKKTPHSRLVLVSESDSLILREDFKRIGICKDEAQVKRELGSRITDWEKLLVITKLEVTDLIKFCSLCEIEKSPLNHIQDYIRDTFSNRVTNSDSVAVHLFKLAFDQAKRNLRTTRTDVVEYLESVGIRSISNLNELMVDESLVKASISLANNPTGFTGIVGNAIQRKETKMIYEWIKNPLKINQGRTVEPLLVLSGDAGTGKTTVLKHLYDLLLNDQTPVLGIKADRVLFQNETQFKEDLNIGDDLEKIIVSALATNDKLIIIIDQIDALSLSLSKDRSQIRNYTNLIYRLTRIEGVRIVVSCRIYDLNYDPSLVKLRKSTVVKMAPLPDDDLRSILAMMGLDLNTVDAGLTELLKTPLHLDIFSRLDLSRIRLGRLQTIQSLYQSLWEQKVKSSNVVNRQRLTEFIYDLANELFENQRIYADDFNDELYSDEYKYLLTENLLRESDQLGKFSFFHQTMFDYVLARKFISSQLSISGEIINAHQGLFLRNKVRMVVSFLRGTRMEQYNREIAVLLKRREFRFHIKLLLIGDVCSQKQPTLFEKRLVKELILEPELRLVIFESINSIVWFKYMSKDLLNHLYLDPQKNGVMVRNVCLRLLDQSESIVLKFLDDTPNFEGKTNLIADVLVNLKYFEDELIKKLYYLIQKNPTPFTESFFFYQFLKNAATKWVDWVFEELFKDIQRSLDSPKTNTLRFELLEHGQSDLYREMTKIFPRETFFYFKKCFFHIVQHTKLEYGSRYKIQDKAFNFFSRDSKSHYHQHFILPIAIKEYLISQMDNDPAFVLEELKELRDSEYSSPCYLFLWIMLEKHQFCLDETFLFVMKWLEGAGFYTQARFQKCIDSFIQQSYTNLRPSQKELLKSYVLNQIDPVRAHQEKKLNPYYGNTQLYILSLIPDRELKSDELLWKLKLELQRKRPLIERGAAVNPSSTVKVPTLNPNSLSKISLENWISFFRKYPEIENQKFTSHYENAQNLEKEVMKNENDSWFLKLLVKFIESEEVPVIYSSKLICGLIDSGADRDLLLKYFDVLVGKHGLSTNNLDYLMYPVDQFSNYSKISDKVFSWLLDCFENSEQESRIHSRDLENEKERDSEGFERGINCAKGSAMYKLTFATQTREQFDQVVAAIERQLEDLNDDVTCVILTRLAWLNKFNKDVCLKLFLKLVKGKSVQTLNSAAHSAQYMGNIDFTQVVGFYEDVVVRVRDQGIIRRYGKILTVAALDEYPGSKSLLEKAFAKSSQYKIGALQMAIDCILENRRSEYIDQLWNRFLTEDGPDFAHSYASFFRRCEPDNFETMYIYIDSFIASKAAKERAHEYYDLLLKCSGEYPEKCINLELKAVHPNPDIRYTAIRREEPMQLIISCYNTLMTYSKEDEYCEKALDTFDDFLRDPDHRSKQESFFDSLDRY